MCITANVCNNAKICVVPSHPHVHVVEPLELKCRREVSEDHVVVTGCTTSNQPVAILCSFEQQPQAECEAQCTVVHQTAN